jgi:hypothetical protein
MSMLLKSHVYLACFQACFLTYQKSSKFLDTGRAAHNHKYVFSEAEYAVCLPFCCINISIYLQTLSHTAVDKLQQYTYHANKQIKCTNTKHSTAKGQRRLQEYIKLTAYV